MGPDQKPVSYRIIATRYTLAQLADIFARQMEGSIIVNQTGLDGEYDFTLELTPDAERPNPRRSRHSSFPRCGNNSD